MAKKRIKFIALKKYVLPFICYFFIFLRDSTKKVVRLNEPDNHYGSKIYATWHGTQHCFLNIAERQQLNVLISRSNDGDIITRALNWLGFKVIRGSASRGGSTAAKNMLDVLQNGQNICFTVDGPRGPIYSVKKNVIRLAQLSGAAIVPLIPETRWKLTVRSWDKYHLPLLFVRSYDRYGKPMHVPEDASDDDIEMYRQKLEKMMRELTPSK